MSQYLVYIAVFVLSVNTVAAEAQTREDKKGWHKQKGHSYGVERGREGSTEFKFKMDMDFKTSITRIVSENAQNCAQKAANPKPDDIHYCTAALAEPELSPENRYSATYNMGLMQMAFGETDTAALTLLSASALAPENSDSYLALAKLETARGDDALAMDYAVTALSKNPKRPSEIHVTIGHLHEREFEFEKARASYEAAIAANGGSGPARRRLARVNRLWPAK